MQQKADKEAGVGLSLVAEMRRTTKMPSTGCGTNHLQPPQCAQGHSKGQLSMCSMGQEAGDGASQGIAQSYGTFKGPLECIGGTMTLGRFFLAATGDYFFVLQCTG